MEESLHGFHTQCITLAGKWGAITNNVLKFRKVITIHSLKKKSELKLLFGKIKNINNNSLLSKFMFKYIVCYQVFPIYMSVGVLLLHFQRFALQKAI